MVKQFFNCILLLFLLSTFCGDVFAFNLRKAGNPTIAGSAVNSIYQDKNGLIWLATTAGLSTYDGKNTISVPGYKGVAKVWSAANGIMNIETQYGFKRLDRGNNSALSFDMFNNVTFSASDSKGNIFIVQGNGTIYYLETGQSGFDNTQVPGLIENTIKAFFIDKADVLRIITKEGQLRSFPIANNKEHISVDEERAVQIGLDILYCIHDGNDIYILDNECKLYQLIVLENSIKFISDLKAAIGNKGRITSAVRFQNDFFLGFESGLYAIRDGNPEKMPLNCGITQLVKDRFQDLIWIGTDGMGVYTYSMDPYSIRTNTFSEILSGINKPVNTIFRDKNSVLWLGTKGDGILKIPNYNPDTEITEVSWISTENGLSDNSVNILAKSKHGIWIGTDNGLQFYSYDNQSIRKINLTNGKVEIKNIQSIYEQDSVLWLASYGQGIVKAELSNSGRTPGIKHVKIYSIKNRDEASNRFLSVYNAGEGILFANKGEGIFKIENEDLRQFRFRDNGLNTINNIAYNNRGGYIVATEFGVAIFSQVSIGMEGATTALNNMSVKDVLHDWWNDYWLSTGNGIVYFNSESGIYQIFDSSYGLEVTEYIAGSSYRDEQSGLLFFGGINGFTSIKRNDYDEAMDYMPALYLDRLAIFGMEQKINPFIKKETDSKTLTLKYDQNFFSLTYNALDYINGNNYSYYYKIGKNGQWTDNGNSGTVSFADLAPGKYTLFIKYYNKILGKDSYTETLEINILYPWYRSTAAYLLYLFLAVLSGFAVTLAMIKRNRKRKEDFLLKTEQRRKEDRYEAKLDFFTNIAHEFCTPLTLIYGPCSRILESKSLNPSIAKYAGVISQNAQRMNALIGDLMDFKQIESGYKQPVISNLSVSEIAGKILDSFTVTAEHSKIKIKKDYPRKLNWNSDEKFLATIISNLISNAFKYTDNGENVSLEMTAEPQSLRIIVSNTGKGIKEENIDKIFDRYTILNDFEGNSSWSRNGLGLAVTAGMVKLLGGTIDVASIPGEITSFTVTLPHIPDDRITETGTTLQLAGINFDAMDVPSTRYEHRDDRPTIMIIDDEPEMLWFICDVLNHEFNVAPVSTADEALEALKSNHPDIVLCDIMMKGMDGIGLTKSLKSNQATAHIPLIIISAVHEIEKQIEAIQSGAEMYITKPFHIDYLKTSIKQLIGRKETLKGYFASPLSAFELSMGKLKHSEHKKFMKQIYHIINNNIQNEDLSAEMIATGLNMSTRSLYRKLKEITDASILEMIHESRLTVAKDLLMKSKLTIEEIIFKSGFPNRAGFYRAFAKKYGCTPTQFKEQNNIS